jgi:dethiobiotin synthetase
VAAAITAGLRGRGVDAIGLKPIITGLDETPDPRWPPDHELLARVSGCPAGEVNAVAYRPPVAPHLAAELSGRTLQPAELHRFVLATAARRQAVVVEGVGGLLVPLTSGGYTVRDLAQALGLPLVIVARPSLGTINHTLLTIEAARHAELEIASVVLTPWPQQPEEIHRSNRSTIARLGSVAVCSLRRIAGPEPEVLRTAATDLPFERWLS